MLKIYSKTVCPFCVNAKKFLKAKDIPFEEINIEENEEAREFLKSQGHRSVPQIYQDGKLFVDGGHQGLISLTESELLTRLGLL